MTECLDLFPLNRSKSAKTCQSGYSWLLSFSFHKRKITKRILFLPAGIVRGEISGGHIARIVHLRLPDVHRRDIIARHTRRRRLRDDHRLQHRYPPNIRHRSLSFVVLDGGSFPRRQRRFRDHVLVHAGVAVLPSDEQSNRRGGGSAGETTRQNRRFRGAAGDRRLALEEGEGIGEGQTPEGHLRVEGELEGAPQHSDVRHDAVFRWFLHDTGVRPVNIQIDQQHDVRLRDKRSA